MDKTAAEVLQGMIYGIETTYGRLYIWSVMEVTDKSHLSSFLGLVHNNGKRTRIKNADKPQYVIYTAKKGYSCHLR